MSLKPSPAPWMSPASNQSRHDGVSASERTAAYLRDERARDEAWARELRERNRAIEHASGAARVRLGHRLEFDFGQDGLAAEQLARLLHHDGLEVVVDGTPVLPRQRARSEVQI